jgi:hypothetical protein
VRSDDEITSDELDELLDDTQTVSGERPRRGTEVRLCVSVDAERLHELEQRAAAEGTDLNLVAADALRTGARPA